MNYITFQMIFLALLVSIEVRTRSALTAAWAQSSRLGYIKIVATVSPVLQVTSALPQSWRSHLVSAAFLVPTAHWGLYSLMAYYC